MNPVEIQSQLEAMGLNRAQILAVSKLIVKTLGRICAKPFVMLIEKMCMYIFCATLFASCSTQKETTASNQDSTSVSKNETGSYSKNENKYDSLFESYRRTWYATQPVAGQNGQDGKDGKDGAIKYVPYPVYTEEYSRGQTSSNSSGADSSYTKQTDSTHTASSQLATSKQTDVLSWKHLLFLGIGIVVALKLLDLFAKIKIGWRIPL